MKAREKLKGRLIHPSDLSKFRKQVKKLKKKVVFTAGNWDILHVGQMRYLEESKKLGDILVVGVLDDDSVRSRKGPNKPVLDEWIRAESLMFLECVDYVTIMPIPSSQPTIELLQPDIFVTVQEDWNEGFKGSKEYQTVIEYGGRVELVDRQSPFISTSQIIQRMIGGELGALLQKYTDMKDDPIKERFKTTENEAAPAEKSEKGGKGGKRSQSKAKGKK